MRHQRDKHGLEKIKDLLAIQERMNRMFEEVVRNKDSAEETAGPWSPMVDIYETESEIVIKADITEIGRDDIRIDLENDKLTISGERKMPSDIKRDQFRASERPYGLFSRTFVLSSNIDQEKIRADYKHGILMIAMPKRSEVRNRQVTVKIV